MRTKFSYLILVLVIIVTGFLIYYYVYPEFLFRRLLEEQGLNISLECWGHDFISQRTSQYTNETFTPREQINYLREFLNQKFINYTKYGIGVVPVCYYNNTKHEGLMS